MTEQNNTPTPPASSPDPNRSDPNGSDPNGSDPTGSDPTGSDPTGGDPSRRYGSDLFRAIELLQQQLDDHTATLQAHTTAVARIDTELRQVKALIQKHGPQD